MKGKSHKQIGVTLLELMFVITIMGLLASLAVPSFNRTIEKRHIVSASEAIQADLRWARSEAIKRNTNVTVSFVDGVAGAWQYSVAPATKAVNSANFGDFDNVAVSQNFTSDVLTFDPVRGTANAGTVVLTSANFTLQVRVSLLGRVRLCGDLSGYNACS